MKLEKKFACVRYTKKTMRVVGRRIHQKTDEFKDRYRWRAGVEATMSELDRRTGAKHLRYRGYRAVCLSVFLKAAGLNILRAARVRKARKKPGQGGNGDFFGLFLAFMFFKDQFLGQLTRPKIFSH